MRKAERVKCDEALKRCWRSAVADDSLGAEVLLVLYDFLTPCTSWFMYRKRLAQHFQPKSIVDFPLAGVVLRRGVPGASLAWGLFSQSCVCEQCSHSQTRSDWWHIMQLEFKCYSDWHEGVATLAMALQQTVDRPAVAQARLHTTLRSGKILGQVCSFAAHAIEKLTVALELPPSHPKLIANIRHSLSLN